MLDSHNHRKHLLGLIFLLAGFFCFLQVEFVQAAAAIQIKITNQATPSITFHVGDTAPFEAVDANGTAVTPVSWSSSNPQVAEINAQTRVLTLKAVGTAVITATVSNGDIGYQTVTVEPQPVALERLELTLSQGRLPFVKGSTQPIKLSPIFTPSQATHTLLNWHSTDPGVAQVDQQGNITLIHEGTATIIAATRDGLHTAFYDLQVMDVAVTGISLNQTNLTLLAGRQEKLIPSISPSHAVTTITWSTTAPTIADISTQDGIVKAMGAGTATVTATTSNGSKVASATVTVVSNTTQARTITPKRKSSSSVELTWTGTTGNSLVEILEGGSVIDSRWTSENKATFTNLDVDQEYKVRINDRDGIPFIIKNLPGTMTISNFKVENVSSTDVDFTWSGTPDRVLVEIKKSGSDRVEDELRTSSRSATFVGLSPDTTYNVLFDGVQAGTFKTEKSVKEFKVVSKSESTVQLSWNGTIDRVHVELKKQGDDDTVDEEWTRNKQADFDDLRPDTTYKVYIDEVYVGSFKTDPGPLVKNLKVTKKSNTSVEITWTDGPSDEVEVVLRKSGNDSIVDEEETSKKKVMFTGLSSSTEYKIYIDDIYMETFRLDKLQTISGFTVITNNQNLSVQLSWTGTEGAVEVALKNGLTTLDTQTTSTRRVSFTGLVPDQEYGIYIDGQLKGNVKLGFPDISNHWAKASINRLFQLKIVNGYEDGKFRPEDTVNREEFATMLVRAKGYTLVRGQQSFTDVPVSYWANPYIQTAVREGIILPQAYGAAIKPLTPITREEMAVMLARALGLAANPAAASFTDENQIQNKELVGAITKAGIIKGYPDQTFRPKNSLTRAEAADVINQIYQP